MIELRWVNRYKIRDPKISGYHEEREKVLQVRYDISASHGIWMIDPEARMSAWSDVPTVREDE